MAAWLSPGRWPVPNDTRNVVLDSAVARGDSEAARIVRAETAGASRPGSPESMRRAAAVDVEARDLVGRERETEHTVARYLRGCFGIGGEARGIAGAGAETSV